MAVKRNSNPLSKETIKEMINMGVNFDKDKKGKRFNLDPFTGFIVGETGSGKSTFIDNLLFKALESKENGGLNLILVDVYHVEFAQYKTLNKENLSIVFESEEIIHHLKELAFQIKIRNQLLESYNYKLPNEPLWEKTLMVFDNMYELQTEKEEHKNLVEFILKEGARVDVFLIVGSQSESSYIESYLGKDFLLLFDNVVRLGSRSNKNLPLGNYELTSRDGNVSFGKFRCISFDEKEERIMRINEK